ncbi:putative divalent heavy-metal cations transporter [Halobacteroides halobius DSM 5150]|uniref:Putative divalent heavy-metal cations transporter n=1 Tax=Halobacteroides halobius (strain ATCC 35273 / DSM 5150 / MD-1) TaxID=748449 RepID=L0KCJ5_HALHC|nr:ZIP family metal transporter [Halobacteroides halobius]AGB42104.1 putative divalent heavy-metal cations transporter [Halobacteroides halobius DSM 5150]
MSLILVITLIGLLAGIVGTGLGGAITLLWRKPKNNSISLMLGLASGVMLSVVLFDLFPEAIEHSNELYTIIGAILGLLVLRLLAGYIKTEEAEGDYIETGILLGLGIALHNFPEGLAIGAGCVAQAKLGISLAVVIALHNLPEGLALATPMNIGGWSPVKVVVASMLPGIPMGLGAFVGALLGFASPVFLTLNLGFAGGGMLYIIIYELVPQAYGSKYGLYATVGVLVGSVAGILLAVLF